jgi:FMN phosphatase YigB (HAD superfamily)
MTSASQTLICFDLGGVLARIRRNWQACANAAGVVTRLPDGEIDLSAFSPFDQLQEGVTTSAEYLRGLSDYLSVSEVQALAVHYAILVGPYEETYELVSDLKRAGLRTACLSNTNELHWGLLNSRAFPGINDLQFKMVSHEIKLLKPEQQVFEMFDANAKVAPEDVIYFDDNEGNVIAAKEHGWNAFFVDHEANPAQQMREVLSNLKLLS